MRNDSTATSATPANGQAAMGTPGLPHPGLSHRSVPARNHEAVGNSRCRDDRESIPLHVLRVRAWDDTATRRYGHDPRSAYVERFWIAVLGPSVVWLLRLLAREFDDLVPGEEIRLDLDDTARRLGLQHRGGRQSTFMRTVDRCREFGLARFDEDAVLVVRRLIPAVPRRLQMRMPRDLRDEIGRWSRPEDRSDFSVGETRLLATCMMTLGHGLHESAERLVTLGLAPRAANEAAAWAWAEKCMRVRSEHLR